MAILMVTAWITTILLFALSYMLSNRAVFQAIGSGSFGNRESLTDEVRRVVVATLVEQQKWSFRLVWTATAAGVAFGVIIWVQLVKEQLAIGQLGLLAAGGACDVWVGKRAYALYRTATTELLKWRQ